MLVAPHRNVEKGCYLEFKRRPAPTPLQIKNKGKREGLSYFENENKFSAGEIGTKNIMCVTII